MDSEDEEEVAAAAAAAATPGAGAIVPPPPPAAGPPVVPGAPVTPRPGETTVEGEPAAEEGGGGEEEEGGGGGNALVSSFLVKEKGCVCQALFVPNGTRLTAPKLQALVAQWKMPGPSTLLSCDAGTVHPRSFASAQLARLDSFKQFWADAQQHAKRAGHTEGQVHDRRLERALSGHAMLVRRLSRAASHPEHFSGSRRLCPRRDQQRAVGQALHHLLGNPRCRRRRRGLDRDRPHGGQVAGSGPAHRGGDEPDPLASAHPRHRRSHAAAKFQGAHWVRRAG